MKIDQQLPECMEELLFAKVAPDGRPVRHRAAYGGRGSTKSHSFARRLLTRGFEAQERVLCAREIQKSIKGSVKKLLDDLIPQMGFGPTNGDGFYHSLEAEIRGRNGTEIAFAGLRSNVESIKSAEGISIAYVTEARSVSQSSIDILTPTIRGEGGEVWWDWNPLKADDPVDKMFRGGVTPPGSIVRKVNYTENPWFKDPLKSEMEWDRSRDPDKYAHIWLGDYQKNSEARVFRNWRVEEFETPYDAQFKFGADWGFAVDPTVLVRAWLKGRTLYVDWEAYEIGCEIDETPALFDQVPGSRKWEITADSSRPETISYLRRQGFDIRKAIKGPGSLEDGVAFLKSFDIVVHPELQHTIDELTLYSYKVDKLTGKVLPVLEDKKNHVVDALRYALEALRRADVAFSSYDEDDFADAGRSGTTGY